MLLYGYSLYKYSSLKVFKLIQILIQIARHESILKSVPLLLEIFFLFYVHYSTWFLISHSGCRILCLDIVAPP